MSNQVPLWRLMQADWIAHTGNGYAAELRCIADAIEARGERGEDLDPGEVADWLRAEAQRAEAGK